MKTKTFATGFKDIDENEGIAAGYASTFNVVDDGDDVVEPGAFSRTINSWGPEGADRIKALYQHDPAWLVGKPIELHEDDNGLYHKTKFSLDNAMSNDVFVLVRDKVITEQSIGYDVVKREMKDGVRHLKELKLWEYSFVTFGMNQYTPITSVKSNKEAYRKLRERMNTMEKLINGNKLDSKEVKHMTSIALDRWQKEVEQLENKTESFVDNVEEGDDVGESTKDSFDEILSIRKFRDNLWKLTSTLEESILSILEENNDNITGEITGTIQEFQDTLVSLIIQAQNEDLISEFSASNSVENEIKAGRVLSAKNRALLEEAREDIDLVLRACDSDDDETQSTQNHGGTDDSADSHSSDEEEDEKIFDDVISELKEIRGSMKANKTKSRLDKLTKELKGDD